MTDYAVTGKKRSGKGLFCAGLIRDALREGKRVATNMDIFMEHLRPSFCKATLIRLPDCPTVADLEALGRGYEGEYDDDRNGLIILDETSMFFNARAWGDKNRQPVLDWLIHSGKLGWDVYYQMQGIEQVDKQLRSTQIEYHISVRRMDKWAIPVLTSLFAIFGINFRLPRMHVGVMRQGFEQGAIVCDRKFYRASDLQSAYDTRQKFLPRDHPDACGLHSVLSAWHLKGRYLPPPPPFLLRFLYGVVGYDWTKPKDKPKPVLKPKHPLVEKLQRLPEPDRLKHWRRLEALGAI